MPRKPPRRTRERILELSLVLFNQFGEPHVTTTTIAEEMRISPGNLYYHFRNKDEITGSLFEQFEREIDRLLDATARGTPTVEDGWLFLHLLFELIWRHRFVYRDLADLLSRNRTLEVRFKAILDRKTQAARALCEGLARAGTLSATPREVEALATNMVVVTTWWLSHEYVRNARHFSEPAAQAAMVARGAYQVLVLAAPYLNGQARELFERLATQYLQPD